MRRVRNRMRSATALALSLLTTGCFTVEHAYRGPKKLTTGPGLHELTRIVHHFEAHDRQFFWFHGGVPVGEPLNGLALAAREAGPHLGVVNLRLSDGQDFTDMAITHVACLFSLLCGTWSVWVEGDVVDALDSASLSPREGSSAAARSGLRGGARPDESGSAHRSDAYGDAR